MNSNPIEQFKTDIRNIRLSDDERSEMRGTLQAFVSAHPSRARVPSHRWIHARLFHRAVFAYALAALLLVTLPTVYASGQSLPGDALYAIKVNVIEPTTEFFSFDAEARAERITDHVQERLREIAVVRSDEKRSKQISMASEELERGTTRARRHLQESSDMPLQKKIEIQKDLLSVVEAHKTILETATVSIEEDFEDIRQALETELIETIDSFVESSSEDAVLEHIEGSIEKIQERVESIVHEEERVILEEGVTQTIAELAEGDTEEALRTLVLSEQNAEAFDVVQSLIDQATETTGTPSELPTPEETVEESATTTGSAE